MERVTTKVATGELDKFFRLDYKIGAVFNQLTEERAQLIPASIWKVLREHLTQEFKEKAPAINFEIGSILGSSFAEQLMRHIGDPEILVRCMSENAASAGWGIISILGDTRYGSRFSVTVANSAFCHEQGLADSPKCDFLVGVIRGISDTVYGVPHRVSEIGCTAMGECVCQFEVEETAEGFPQRSPFIEG